MKRNILILSLLACMSTAIMAEQDVNVADSRGYTSCCKKSTCAPTPISCATIIKHSGCYCLTRDIEGQIIIAANNVTLDLNCHSIDGNGSSAAISAEGFSNLTVKNGAIANDGSIGLAFTTCDDIRLEDLNFHPVNQAIILFDCFNGDLVNIVANFNFTTGRDSIISLGFCDGLNLVDVEVSNNIVSYSRVLGLIDGFHFGPLDNCTFTRCRVNNNERRDSIHELVGFFHLFGDNVVFKDCQANGNFDNGGDNENPHEGIGGIVCGLGSNYLLENCQANNNRVAFCNDTSFGFAPALANNVIMTDCQANSNTVNNLFGALSFDLGPIGIWCRASNNCLFTNCQANNNSVDRSIEPGDFWTGPIGFNSFGSDFVFDNCQANSNTIGTNQKLVVTTPAVLPPINALLAAYSPSPFVPTSGVGELVIDNNPPTNDACSMVTNDLENKIGICYRGGCGFVIKTANIEAREAVGTIVINDRPGAPFSMTGPQTGEYPSVMISLEDGNALLAALAESPETVVSIGSSNPNDTACGFNVFSICPTQNFTFRNCQANRNGGGQQGYGMIVVSEADCVNNNILFENCSANSNSATQVVAGIAAGSRMDTPAFNVTIDGCEANQNSAPLAYGFVLENTFGSNVLNSQANGNRTAGVFLGPLLAPQFGSGQVNNDDVCLFNNIVKKNGTGFLFDAESVATNVLVEGNTAINNTVAGYDQQGDFTGSWLSNVAQGNGENFVVTNTIQEFTLVNGTYTNVDGQNLLTSLANISAN